MKFIFLLSILIVGNLSAQQENKEQKLNTEYALKLLLKLDAIMNADSNIVYAFDKNDLNENASELLVLDSIGNLNLDYNQLDVILTVALKELVKRNKKLDYKVKVLETENSNLKIYINNELTFIKEQIDRINNEIAP